MKIFAGMLGAFALLLAQSASVAARVIDNTTSEAPTAAPTSFE
jgi:hypothetical protein